MKVALKTHEENQKAVYKKRQKLNNFLRNVGGICVFWYSILNFVEEKLSLNTLHQVFPQALQAMPKNCKCYHLMIFDVNNHHLRNFYCQNLSRIF